MPRAEIAAKQATFTLEKLHAQLGGRILDNKAEAKRLAQAMKHVEAVLKLLDPAYSVRSISVRRRQPNQLFKRGTILRHALDAMRTASNPPPPLEAFKGGRTNGAHCSTRRFRVKMTDDVSFGRNTWRFHSVDSDHDYRTTAL